jgi:chromosome segregation ATPase
MTNNTFLQLMDDEKTTMLSVEQREFVETHKQIVSYGNLAGRYFVELARKLKTMRDGKMYKAAGFEDFGAYVEEAVGLKTRQAYNYIKVAEKYTDKYLEDHADIGITKLTLLAQVTESEREEIEEKLNLGESTAKDVEEAVREAIRERDEKQKQLDLFAEENENLKAELAERESGRDSLQKAYEEKKAELAEAKKQADDLKAKKSDLEKKLKETKEAAKEIKTVPDEESKKIAEEQRVRAEELEKKLRETNALLTAAKEQKKTIASDELLVFKVKFEDLQRLGDEIGKSLSGMDQETASKCKNALNAVLNSWKEDMGL